MIQTPGLRFFPAEVDGMSFLPAVVIFNDKLALGRVSFASLLREINRNVPANARVRSLSCMLFCWCGFFPGCVLCELDPAGCVVVQGSQESRQKHALRKAPRVAAEARALRAGGGWANLFFSPCFLIVSFGFFMGGRGRGSLWILFDLFWLYGFLRPRFDPKSD